MTDKVSVRNLHSFWPLRYSGAVQILALDSDHMVELISVDTLTYEMFYLMESMRKRAIIYYDKQI